MTWRTARTPEELLALVAGSWAWALESHPGRLHGDGTGQTSTSSGLANAERAGYPARVYPIPSPDEEPEREHRATFFQHWDSPIVLDLGADGEDAKKIARAIVDGSLSGEGHVVESRVVGPWEPWPREGDGN